MPAGGSTTRSKRLLGTAALAGGALWLVAAPLILLEPPGLPAEQVYGTVVAAAAVLLVAGATGVRYRFGWPRSRWLAGFTAMWRRLDRVLDPSYRHQTERGLRDVPGHSTSARVGVFLLRFGLVLLAVAGLQLAVGEGGLSWRGTFWFAWFLTYGGAFAVGLAILWTSVLPRRGGILLLAGSLAVGKAAAIVLVGRTQRPESLGPLLPLEVGEPWMVAVATVLWVAFGLAWWEIGRALRATDVEAR